MNDSSNPRTSVKAEPSPARHQRDGGYLLLAIMLMMALMVIAATVAAPRYVQQIKRDREEEMIHRGTQYARAIKKFYKKNGRYPASLDDLDKGQIKFLRQRYKDPLTKDGKWKLLNYADIQTLLNSATPGTPAASMGTLGGANGASGVGSSSFSSSSSPIGFTQSPLQQQQQVLQQQQNTGAINGGFPSNSDMGGTNSEGSGNNFGGSGNNLAGNPTGSSTGSIDSNNGQSGTSNNFGSSQPGGGTNGNQASGSNSASGQSFGGGAIVGVASISKDPTIRIYNKKKTYDEWQFIYNPMMDQANVLLKGPYQPTTIGANQQIGTPAGQMNGQQQQSPFGQSNSSFGQSNNNSSFGQQNGIGSQNSPQPSPSPQ